MKGSSASNKWQPQRIIVKFVMFQSNVSYKGPGYVPEPSPLSIISVLFFFLPVKFANKNVD